MVGLAGESQNFDGNGSYVRFQPGGGARHGRARHAELGDRQARRLGARARARRAAEVPGQAPAVQRERPLLQEQDPERQRAGGRRRAGRGDAVRIAIRKHWLDFVAIIGLILIAGAVAVYILGHQRLTLPGWVPFVGKDFFVVKAEISTAQAVTPGQGQTVNIAGVQVGEISNVELKDGKARRHAADRSRSTAASTRTRPCCCGRRPA